MSKCRHNLIRSETRSFYRMKKILIKKNSLIVLSICIILCDQLSKFLAIQILSSKSSIILIPKLIQLRLVMNTGAAFSLFSNATPFLSFLSLCVSVGLIIWLVKNKTFPIWKGLGLSFLLGGCIGNGIDRWRLGYVNDFIEIIPINFPIFNTADIAINIAIICLIIDTMNNHNKHKLS